MTEKILQELVDSFRGLSFEESTHTYSDDYGTRYTSCTEFVKKFEYERDWNEIRRKSALKRIRKERGDSKYEPTETELNAVVETLRAEWETAGQYAATLGTEIHAVMEYLWQGEDYAGDLDAMSKFPGMLEDFVGRKKLATDIYRKLSRRYEPIANEFRIYDRELKLAGTVDFLAWDRIDNVLAIVDWKSSKKFSRNAWRPEELMRYPFDKYEDCNVNHYSLQLSLYKYIIERNTGLKVGKLILYQLPKSSFMPESCECRDMTTEINVLFNL